MGDQQYPVHPAESAEANDAAKATVPVCGETKYDITKNKNPTVVWYWYYELKSVDTYNGQHGVDKTLKIGLSNGTIVTYEEYYGECHTPSGCEASTKASRNIIYNNDIYSSIITRINSSEENVDEDSFKRGMKFRQFVPPRRFELIVNEPADSGKRGERGTDLVRDNSRMPNDPGNCQCIHWDKLGGEYAEIYEEHGKICPGYLKRVGGLPVYPKLIYIVTIVMAIRKVKKYLRAKAISRYEPGGEKYKLANDRWESRIACKHAS